MELIDKSAAISEIERRIGLCAKQREDMLDVQCYTLADDASARIGELNCIKDFIDTLEVKEEIEVDLEKEIENWIENNQDTAGFYNNVEFARHFFELGLKARKEG